VKYLLDTNICVFVIRQKSQLVLDRLRLQPEGNVGISIITLAELRYGAEKSQNPFKNHAALDAFLAFLEIIDFDAEAADVYGRVRARLEAQGTPIGSLDNMIAAHAVRLAAILVTNNVREFMRVAGLTIEDWSIP
jgi:tRNA(fMet)-specific endonuclease VapC